MTKKTGDKIEKKESAEKKKYFYAVGRRKAAVAQVFLYDKKSKEKDDDFLVNKISAKKYFPTETMQNSFFAPLVLVGTQDKMSVSVKVKGGGKNGQVKASQLGISRALVKFDKDLRKTLRAAGFLTRDSRKVERKKPGMKKSRRAPQWVKR